MFDVTLPLTTATVAYPGDPVFSSRPAFSLSAGDPFGMCELSLGNHAGTHIDFPAHVIPGAKTSSDFPVKHFMGRAKVLEIARSQPVITSEVIKENDVLVEEDDIVLFKTVNSALWTKGEYDPGFVYLDVSAAQLLARRRVRIVGIDYICIDTVKNHDLLVHHLLLSSEVLIIEGLNLAAVQQGVYNFIALPMHIPDADGLPARVLLEGPVV
ncbi:cyclase family protein [bacterium]|nr:cyclase family protein [bacterium]MBU1918864.1 cyclase family protein [bacterium]